MSNFTTSGVRLIADGTESGTWGGVTNTNLEILNRMINEAGSVSFGGATETVTVSDGALSAGHYAVLVLGGGYAGTTSLTIAPNDAQRVIFIKNSRSYTATILQGGGTGTTVAIPAGQSRVVYTDGSGVNANVVDISSSFIPSTLTAISNLTPTDGNFVVGNGSTWITESGDTALASLGVTATASELNVLDGVSINTTELNYLLNASSNIQNQLNAKAPLASPALTGTPTAPTPTTGDNTTKIATTAFVQASLAGAGSGDMLKSVYDPSDYGIVENAATLMTYTGGVPTDSYTAAQLTTALAGKAASTDPSLSGTVSIVNGGAGNDWSFSVDGSNNLVIKYGTVTVARISSAGAITAKDDVTAFGSI